jgi:hypothetical protein
VVVDHRRSVVPCVAPIDGAADQGCAKITVAVPLRHSTINRSIEVATDEVDVLANVQEHHGVASVLAKRHLLFRGNLGALQQPP